MYDVSQTYPTSKFFSFFHNLSSAQGFIEYALGHTSLVCSYTKQNCQLHFINNYCILWEEALFLLFVRRVGYLKSLISTIINQIVGSAFFFFNLVIIGYMLVLNPQDFFLRLVVLCPKFILEKSKVKQAMTTHLSGYKGLNWFEQMAQNHKIFYWLQHFFLVLSDFS